MITNYWPWWLGGGLLAAVAIAFPLLVGIPLGVSGALARLLRWWKEIPNGKNELSNRPSAGAPSGCNSPTTTGLNRTANLLFLVGILIGGALAGIFVGIALHAQFETKLGPASGSC